MIGTRKLRLRFIAQTAKSLIEEGLVEPEGFPDFDTEDGFKDPQTTFIDDINYDGTAPNDYINKFPIGLKQGVQL